jgi:hypothetical protein
MNTNLPRIYAVGAIRVSTEKQGRDGDSPDDQKRQIDRYGESRNMPIRKYFAFLESGSKVKQPMQEVIDYCKDPKNQIKYVIIKSIDRFTRGGSRIYEDLKEQLDVCGVSLVDVYGVISAEKVNTLDHLGFAYKWSEYSPSKKTEILEAERAKDELRDIMSRMIGAEIRYTQVGYWMRQPPFGFVSEKIETRHGKRTILKPHIEEAPLIRKMYELKALGTMSDRQIVDKMNELGFRTRKTYVRDNSDRSKIIGTKGGNPLEMTKINRYLENPIYAGVVKEKWTNDKPVNAAFEGLVSFELYNQANRSRAALHESADGDIEYEKVRPDEKAKKGVHNDEFAYRRFIACPTCHNPLLGSASRGKMGKYYPAYHCSNHGRYYRIPKQEFEDTISEFVKNISINSEKVDALTEAVMTVWEQKHESVKEDSKAIQKRIDALTQQKHAIIDKIKIVSSVTAIEMLEADLVKTEEEIVKLAATESSANLVAESVDIHKIVAYVKYFMEHLHELLLDLSNSALKAQYFSVLFDKAPTYEDIKSGTQKESVLPEVNELFSALNVRSSLLVTLAQSIYKELADEIIRWNDILSGLNYRESAAF